MTDQRHWRGDSTLPSPEGAPDDATWAFGLADATSQDAAPDPGTPPPAAAPSQVVFIEGSVADFQILADGVKPGVKVVILNPDANGVQQIADYLQRHHIQDLSAISIVADGADGELQLGTAQLDSSTIGQYQADLAAIGAALQPGGDIQLYGCDVAQDPAGDTFLQQLSQATGGANIAASSHLVGAAADGGNWDLNVAVGTVDVASPFTAAAVSAYPNELSLTANQIIFDTFNEGNSSTDDGDRVEQFGVSGSTEISGSTIDLGDGSQSSYSGLNYLISGIAVDIAKNEYFAAADDNLTPGGSHDLTIQEGSLSGTGGVSTVYTDPLQDAEGSTTNFAILGGLAIDPQTNELYYAQAAENASTGDTDAADTGIYKASISNSGSLSPTLLTPTSAGLVNPDYIALDPSANLAFFTDSIEYDGPGFPATDNLDEVNLSTGSVTVMKSFFSSTDAVDLLQGLAVSGNTIYLTTVDYSDNTSTTNQILSIPFTVTGSGSTAQATVGTVTTLYSGTGADQPIDIVIDAAQNIFYTTGEQFVQAGTYYGAVYEGSLSGGSSLTEVLSMSTIITNGDAAQNTDPTELVLLTQPTITAGASATYPEGGSAVVLDSNVTVTDPDSGGNLAGATVTISGVLPTDMLNFTNQNGISGSYDATSGVLTLTGPAIVGDYETALDSVTYNNSGDPTDGGTDTSRTISWAVNDSVLSSNPADSSLTTLCFCADTMIATPEGEVAVQRLAIGDTVITASGAARKITWIGVGRVLATRGRRTAATPVIVRKGALADNVPNHDLRVSKGHALCLDEVLIPVEFLVNHRSIVWDDRAQEVSFYHIELDTHDVLLANGAPAESYRDDGNRWLFHNANSGWGLPPQEPCRPVLTGGPIVDAAWRRLLGRAGARPGVPLTDDPDLHLLADGKRIDHLTRSDGRWVFRLATMPRQVRIMSHAVVPAELGLARDERLLGVAIRRIAFRQRAAVRMLQAADPRLGVGFHAFEPENLYRWTDGDALVPAELFAGANGPFMLELQVAETAHYPLLAAA